MPSSANVLKKQNVSQVQEMVKIPDIQVKGNFVEVIKNTASVKQTPDADALETLIKSDEKSPALEDSQTQAQEVLPSENEFVPFVPERVEIVEPKPVLPTKEELLELLKDDVEAIKKEAYENAYNKAYEDALSRKKGEFSKIISDVDDCLLQMQNLHKEYFEKYALELKYFAVDIAEKLVMDKIYEDELVLKKLVMQTVDSVKNSSWLEIELSQRLELLINTVRDELAKSNLQGRVSVSGKSGADDHIRVNSEKGTIVADVSRQAVNLKELFKSAK